MDGTMKSDKSKDIVRENEYTILIVDDDQGHCSLMQKCLHAEGFRTFRTATCAATIEWLNDNTADLMLLDHKLPDMTGREMIRHLTKTNTNIPFVVVSGQGDERLVVEMIKAGAIDYIVKDTAFIQFLPSVVYRALEQVEQQRRLVLAEESLKWESDVNKAIARLSSALLKPSTTVEEISNLLLDHAKDLTNSKFGFVGYIDQTTASLISPTLTKDIWHQCQVPDKSIVFEKFAGLWGWVLKNKKSVIVNSIKDDPRSTGVPPGHIPIERFLSAPCIIHDELVGQIALANSDRDYTERHLQLVQRLAEFYALVIQRKRSEQALQQSEERFRQAITGAPLPIMIHAEDGEVIRINNTWTELTGYNHSDIPTISQWTLRAYGKKKEVIKSVIDELYKAKTSSHEGAFSITTSTGRTLIWDFSSAPLGQLPDGRRLVISMALDITEQQQAEEEIVRLAKFPSENPNPILRITENGILLYANAASQSMLKEWNCSADQPVPEQWYNIVMDVVKSGKNERIELEYDNRLYAFMVVPVAQGGYVTLYGRDITERRSAELELQKAHSQLEARIKERTMQLQRVVADLQNEVTERIRAEEKILQDQQQLREMASELMLAEEKERREIAVTLHDSIGQILAFTSIELANFLKSTDKKTGKPLAHVRKMIEQAIAETRALTFDLSPTILYTFGLDAAMEQLSEQFAEDHGLNCTVHFCQEPRPIDSAVQILLYRAIRELLVNTAKHAKAKNVRISSRRVENSIEIVVEDDGEGFDLFSIDATKGKFTGLGLFSIRERIAHLGGQMNIESKPGKGTKIALLAPLEGQYNKQ